MRLLFLLLFIISTNSFAKQAQVAIIIDDIGYRISDKNALTLSGNITFSVLPHTPFGLLLAEQAYRQHRDVILHIPMEAENGKKLGPGALTSTMTEQHIRASLQRSFEEIPFAIGINNHMGSKLTKLVKPMTWTMKFLKERDLLFIDSMTTIDSKAEQVALATGVPSLHRHIFLDNQLNIDYITKQFLQLISQAQQLQSAIAIAHPHPETIAALTQLLPLLEKNNIQLVSISALMDTQKTAEHALLITE